MHPVIGAYVVCGRATRLACSRPSACPAAAPPVQE